MRPPDEYPAVIVRRLEQSSGGCRWLLNSWAEVLNVIHCQAAWGEPEIIRFVGLLGKRGIEAYFDAELNSLFHAFDRLFNGLGQKFWNARRDRLPVGFRGGFEFASYREVASAPSNEDDAWLLICTVAERQIDRLEKLLEFHKAIEAEEASERDDLAALDTSPAFERHRRYRSALHRELMKLMDALRKARGEACEDGVASGQWPVASEDGVASGQWSVASESGTSGESTQEECTAQEKMPNEAIYERGVVKRGGADFASRVPAHPLRRRLRSIWPISDLSADDSGVHPATHPLSPRPRESFLPQCRQCTKR